MDKKAFLDYLFYDIGKQQYDFFLQYSEEDGIKTKWRKYSQVCFECNNPKNKWFIEKCNQRQILPCEVVLDLEDKEKINSIVDDLKQLGLFFYVYDTGSRGYHVHIFFNRELSEKEKRVIIKHYGADEQKCYSKCLIALENSKHWKSGKIKCEVTF